MDVAIGKELLHCNLFSFAPSQLSSDSQTNIILMRSSITIAFLAVVPSIYAQSSTSSAQPSVQTIQVGNGGYQYSPNVSNLAVGSTIVFEFMSTNHSVVKAAFGVPCQPYDYINRGQPSFYSGVFNGQDVFSDDVSIYPRRQPAFTDDLQASKMESHNQRY